MKVVLGLLLIGTAIAYDLKWTLHEKVKDVKDKQHEVNALLTGLGSEDTHNYMPKDFPYADTKYYRDSRAVGKFLTAWEEGFITKDSYFSLYSYKNRHDTYRLFDIFYFAKDFETFIKISKWARSELHPLQFAHAFYSALIHRQDTSGIAVPHFYEILPNYYVPSDIIQGVYKAYIKGEHSRNFDFNTTGHEYSWYMGQTMESFKSGPKWNLYDTEARMSYYTEDVGLADHITKAVIAFAPWLSDEKYPDMEIERKGEFLYAHYRYWLYKYNLERYGNGLPPVQPLSFNYPIKTGYNPHLLTVGGHPFTARPDGLVPFDSNPEGFSSVLSVKKRYDDVTDLLGYMEPTNSTHVELEDGFDGLNKLGNLVYGSTHPQLRVFYNPFHYKMFEAVDTAVRSSNDVGLTGSVVSNYLTEMRDPIFYRVLATVHQVFRNYFTKLQPYTRKELGFPGVKLNDFQFTKLETFFEPYEYDVTNSVPFKGKAGSGYQYTVSQARLNHKPFTFKFNVKSDKAQDAIVRIYFAPSYDASGRELGIAQKVEQAVGVYTYTIKLKSGMNTFSGSSDDESYYVKELRLKHISQKLKSGKSEPFYFPKHIRCGMPNNLILPKGAKGGKSYTLFAMVHPAKSSSSNQPTGPCHYNVLTSDDKLINFPVNRRAIPSYFESSDNILFKDITIYHSDQF